MLTDNFPFRAHATIGENTLSSESVSLDDKALATLKTLSSRHNTSIESIVFSLFSAYLYQYMGDNLISTICIDKQKTTLLNLPLDDTSSVKDIAGHCHALLSNHNESYFNDDFAAIRVITQTDQATTRNHPFLLDVSLVGRTPHVQLHFTQGVLLEGSEQLIVHQFSYLINHLGDLWENSISSISLMTDDIRNTVLNDFRIEHKTFDYHYGIYHRFLTQVEKNPNNIAIVFGDKRITYKILSYSVNDLAAKMYQTGVKEGDRIGVFLHRSEWSIISLLAILKLGASYIPLDCTYPEKYIKNIQKETHFTCIISETALTSHIESLHCQKIDVTKIDQYKASTQDLPFVYPQPHHEFAILYTSGTTGNPKGAIYNHASPLNKFSWMWDFFQFKKDDVFLQRTSVNFSPSLWEFFGALLIGLKTVIVPDSVVKDPARLIDTIDKENVTFMGVVPALLRMLFEADNNIGQKFEKLRYISCSGEPMQIDLYQKVKNIISGVRLFNDYGSTEMNAVGYSEITNESTKSKNFPIGKPISNVYYYILNDDLQLVPPYMTGNLYVGGVSLLNGYVNENLNPFIADPVLNTGIEYFKSGDKARFLSNGDIELVGRDDFIVKVRGMRVSLYQVETVIKANSQVADACVVSRKNRQGDNEVVAYLSTSETVLNVRSYCMSVLPEYMVPAKFITYGVLPKKTNGKLDRKYLADLAAEYDQEKPTAPLNPNDIKATLLELIKTSFAGPSIENDCPFSLLGMTSVDAVVLTANINEIWSLDTSVTLILQYDTIDQLSDYVDSLVHGKAVPLAKHEDLDAEVSACHTTYHLPAEAPSDTIDNILVTGANGFLGICVVASLLQKTTANVFCAVRASSQYQAERKVKKSLIQNKINIEDFEGRLNIVCAEISEDYLGLSHDDYLSLSSKIDGVFHLAADTNHFSDYLSLKKSNVTATKNIIDFCFSQKAKTLIFSSSISVLLKHSHNEYHIDKRETLVPSDGLYNGYGKTKWVSENILDDARKKGLKIGIVRLGELSFHSEVGVYRTDDIFHSCLKLIAQVSHQPEWDDGYINCLAVDQAAEALIEILKGVHVVDTEASGDYIFNLVSSNPIPVNNIFIGKPKVSLEKWLDICKTYVENNESDYPPAFSSFFVGGEKSLIKEYFKNIDIDMNAYDRLRKGAYLKDLPVLEKTIKNFCEAN